MGVEYKFDLMLSTDGSGRGAALVAAVLQNQQVTFLCCEMPNHKDYSTAFMQIFSLKSMRGNILRSPARC